MENLVSVLGYDLSLDPRVWEAVAGVAGVPFADSYLCKAKQAGKTVTPHTLIAHERLSMRPEVRQALRDLGVTLHKPLHFGHPGRPESRSKPLPEPDYEAMSITDKIRFHRIQANAAEIKAGPQWRRGGRKDAGQPVKAEDMPPAWHEWKAKAAFHKGRISKLLKHDEPIPSPKWDARLPSPTQSA